jgi:hypothetical protein
VLSDLTHQSRPDSGRCPSVHSKVLESSSGSRWGFRLRCIYADDHSNQPCRRNLGPVCRETPAVPKALGPDIELRHFVSVERPIATHIRILIQLARAQYLLTEVGHGLDAKNLETIATMLPNGEFDLHTPKPSGAK